jgi:hypothetical protein
LTGFPIGVILSSVSRENKKMTKTTSKSLLVATLRGGDASDDFGSDAIWLDLTSDPWMALVESREAAEALAHNTGATLVEPLTEWDGSPFGDGNLGTVTSDRIRHIHCDSPDILRLPEGWTVD